MKTRSLTSLLTLCLLTLTAITSINYASERPLTPFERITTRQEALKINVTDANANELIPRVLERSGLQYAFIRSPEDRLLSIKTNADTTLALETIAFAAGFNIHKNGNYWVVHPLPLEEESIVD